MALTGRQQESHWLAAALGPQVELGGEAALAPAERLLMIPSSPARACRVLVGTDHRTVHVVQLPVHVPLPVAVRL